MENKIRIQKLVFPEGLSIKPKSREYLAKKNELCFALTSTIKEGWKVVEMKKPIKMLMGFS